MKQSIKRLNVLAALGAAILASLTACDKITADLPATKVDDASLGGTYNTGTPLGEVRTESDPAPTSAGVWLLTERKMTWVISAADGSTEDRSSDLPLGRWVRLGDVQNWGNPLAKIFLEDEPAGAKIRGVIFKAVRGMINDGQGNKLCDFDFTAGGPVEVATSNRRAYTSDGSPLPRQILPQSAQAPASGGGACLFGGQ